MINSSLKNKYRKILVYVLLTLVCIIIALLLLKMPSTVGWENDFVPYWSAGHLLASDENPYSLENTLHLFPDSGVEGAFLFLYPPVILPIFIPFGLLPIHLSMIIWLLLSVMLLLISSTWIWRVYRGPSNKRWVMILVVLFFTPAIFALFEAQVSFLLLLGISGFLYFGDQRKWFIAGVFMSLLSIKIQLLLPFLVIVGLWIIYERRWKVMAGAVLAILISLFIVIIIRPSILNDYLLFIPGISVYPCIQPVLGALFCVFGEDRIGWLSYIPTTIGITLLVIIWWRNKDKWSWKEWTPLFIIISLLTAPYAYMHDQVLFLIPVLEVAIVILMIRQNRTSYFIMAVYLLVNVIALILIPTLRYDQIYYLWMPILFLGLYILAKVKLFPIRDDQLKKL